MSSPIVKATVQAVILSAISNVLAQLISCYRGGRPFSIDPVPLGQFMFFSLLSCPPNFLWQQWLESQFPGYTGASEPGTADSMSKDPTVKAVTEKAAPALQTLNEKATAAATALDDTEIVQMVKRRATEGVESVKAKAKEYEARAGLDVKGAATKASDLITPQTLRTAERQTLDKFEQTADGKPSHKKLNIKNTAIKFSLDQTLGAVANTVLFIGGMGALRGETIGKIMSSVRSDSIPLLLAGQKLWPAVSIISFTMVPVEKRTVFGGIIGVGWGIFLSLLAGGKK